MIKTTKKICFALLVHNNPKLVEQMIENINYFCPTSTIVLYNGGDNPHLIENLNVPICPTSKKIKYGNLAIYFIETMEWLEETGMDYDYFINLDSDALFFRNGFEEFIEEQMKETDYIGGNLHLPDHSWFCGQQFKKDITRWEPFFCVNPFWGVFNVGQVMSRRFVKALVNYKMKDLFKKAIADSPVFGIEEIVFVNMAKQLGFNMKNYPSETYITTVRFRPYFTVDELAKCINLYEQSWLCHPIQRVENDPARQLIYRLQNSNFDPDLRKEKFPWFHNDESKYSPSLSITSKLNYTELVARTENNLTHYYKDGDSWYGTDTFANGVKGTPLFHEGNHGYFEVVATLESGGVGHWCRDNYTENKPWFGPTLITKDDVEPLLLTQLDNNNLFFIGLKDNQLVHWMRDGENGLLWNSPYN